MSQDIRSDQVSSYLDYLPAVLRDGRESPPFIGRLLLAFEKILGGLGDPDAPGLGETIGRIHTYFDPDEAPAEFLPWLANWVALGLREDWGEEQKRRFILRIVSLYRLRGTKRGLVELLQTYTDMGVEIQELNAAMQVGVTSTVGEDTVVGGGAPHYFIVTLYLREPNRDALLRQTRIARAIIDQEKPAHTYYDLQVVVPTMQIGVTSTLGVDTLLGT
jgi:phage tail-like protein